MLYAKRYNDKMLTYWLVFAIIALALAGMFALLLVSARSPIIQDIFPLTDLFHKSLTVHVNLSVLVWFLTIGCVIWQLAHISKPTIIDKISYILAIIGVVSFVVSPFVSRGDALLNNYVPILNNPIFIAGILLFLSSIFIQACYTIIRLSQCKNPRTNEQSVFHYAALSAAFIYFIAMLGIIIAYFQLKTADYTPLLGTQYYELLFWGGGHILQLFYTQIMMLGWLWMAYIIGCRVDNIKIYHAIFCLNLFFALLAIYTYISYSADATEHLEIFTQMMRYFGGISPILLAAFLLWWGIKNSARLTPSHYNWMLFWSVLMFGFGGMLAFMIQGVNTVIPAHYHGSIVAVTMALMGIVCHILPELGFSPISKRFMTLQPCIYGVGQLLHIIGLAWSGGYGALRKTPGAIESLEGQAAMGLMGLGGFLSVIGGILFVIMCGRSLLKNSVN